LWGKEDRLGTLNLLEPGAVSAVANQTRSGSVYSLNLALDNPSPEYIGRQPYTHRYSPLGLYGADDCIDGYNTQISSQWDGFGHVRHPLYGHYNGLSRLEHGVDHWARRGICGRGVLADVARWREYQGKALRMDRADPITASDLRETLAWQGTRIKIGDILLIRTGWVGWYSALDATERQAVEAAGCTSPGLEQSEETCRYLWNLHIAAAASDNTSFEAAPFQPVDHIDPASLADPAIAARHTLMYNLLALLGLPFGELFELDALARHCERTGSWTFLFASAPLRLRGGIGSPANALAVL
jgi:kynurenine formamidase